MPRLPFWRPACVLVLLLALGACAEPPTREMDQAQGAIDAARAAGAAEYAPEEFTAAETSLKRAHTAVAERDYRQALSYALDARDRARTAASEAATRRAQLGTATAERIEEAARALQTAKTQPVRDAATREARNKAFAELEKLLQEARSHLAAGKYADARTAADRVLERVPEVIASTTEPARGRSRSSGRR